MDASGVGNKPFWSQSALRSCGRTLALAHAHQCFRGDIEEKIRYFAEPVVILGVLIMGRQTYQDRACPWQGHEN
jgi:hypothetical protein